MKTDDLDQMLYDLGKETIIVPQELNKQTYNLIKSQQEKREAVKHGILLAIALFVTGLVTLISLSVICVSILRGNYTLLIISVIYLIIECGLVALMLLIKENLLTGIKFFKGL